MDGSAYSKMIDDFAKGAALVLVVVFFVAFMIGVAMMWVLLR